MPVVKTPRAIIDVLDAGMRITGHEIEHHYSFEGEGAELFNARIVRDPATLEEVEALRQKSSDALTVAHQQLNRQIADLQELIVAKNRQIAALEAKIVLQRSALNAVAHADSGWDDSVRPLVTEAMA